VRRGIADGNRGPGHPRTATLRPFGRGTRIGKEHTLNGDLIDLVEQLVYARPASEREARAALEWLAARDGKHVSELIEERRKSAPPLPA
jgi:hypothetical protein